MKRYSNNAVLWFSDTHAPYHHKKALEFLGDIASDFQPDRVVCGGDLGDIYSVSNYPNDIDHKDTWHDEVKGLRKFCKKLGALFPKMEVMESNHDDRAYRKSRTAGLPREFLVPYKDIIGASEGWKFHPSLDLTVDSNRSHWHFSHTINGTTISAAKYKGCNVCIGHKHSQFGATAFDTGRKLLWGVDGGCLISDKGSPFAYNKTQVGRPVRGCVMILEGIPHMIPMV